MGARMNEKPEARSIYTAARIRSTNIKAAYARGKGRGTSQSPRQSAANRQDACDGLFREAAQ